MIPIPQGNTSIPIPFPVLANSGNYSGDPTATPTVKLSKNGASQVDAVGKVVPVGNGGFWFWPAAQDVDTPGPVMMFVVVSSGDIASWPGYYVQAPSFWQQLIAIPQNIATAVTLLQRLVTAQRA